MTTYRLTFLRDAEKEWNKLGSTIRHEFAKVLQKRLSNPRVPSARLSDLPDCYKIKLRSAGYRLVYRVYDDRIVVHIIAVVGRRERNDVYKAAAGRV